MMPLSAVAAELPQSSPPSLDGLDGLTEHERDLYYSDDLKVISIDPSTGAVTSVEAITAEESSARIADQAAATQLLGGQLGFSPFAVSTGCLSGAPCWYGQAPTLTYQYTLGTTSGTWSYRKDFYTGNYYAKLCWLVGLTTFCMPERNGKNAWIEFGSVVVGKQVNLSTTR